MFKKGPQLIKYVFCFIVCFSDITMEQWLLGDLCSSLNTEPKKLVSYNSQAPVAMFSLTSLCFGSCDSMSSHDDDVIVLDDEVQRFMELIVIVTKYNTIACLKRYTIN